MTMHSFYDIPLGSTTSEVVATAGKPHAIHQKGDGIVEYEYLERIKEGARNVETRHYYLIFRDGKVSSKRVEQTSPPGYNFDSYEMQTTRN